MDVSQYLDIFIDETNGHIQSLNDNIMILEKEPENKDTINEIFRAAHSLKGMAGTMGFKRMQHLTHDMENLFSEVRNDAIKVNSELIDILFQCLDAIEGYLENVKGTSDEGTEDNEVLIKRLNDFLASGGSASQPAAAPKAEAPAAASETPSENSEAPYKALSLDDKVLEKMKDAKSNLYGVTVYINKDCLLKAARAFLVFKAVEEYGEILYCYPATQDIEDEKFDFEFSMIISTDGDIEAVKSAMAAVSEIDSVVCGKVTVADYDTESAEEKSAPVEEAAPAAAVAVKEEKTEAPAPAAAPAQSQSKDAGNKPAANKPVTARTIRVDIEKLDALMNQVSELIIAKNSLTSISNADNGEDCDVSQLREQIEYLERITTNLHESVMKVRMVPIESAVNKFPRMIRDLSRKLGKPMDLVMTGEETELDRTVVDQLSDPLQHLLRNSADHGIEDAATRLSKGKPEQGNIFLKAFQEGNSVIIEVGDDGAGIDTEKVKAKAIQKGLVSAEAAEHLSQKEIIDFLTLPGFSMAKEITDISGRGVGLDVVKSNIEALGGDVEVKSVLGEGTTFTVRLPLSLAIIQALMVEIRDEKYAIALASISNIESIPVSDIKYVENREVIYLRGQVIPVIRLDEILDSKPKDSQDEELTVVVCKKGDSFGGLVVDNLIGQQEIVIKSIGKCIENNKLISGATVLGDGEVALILDVNALV